MTDAGDRPAPMPPPTGAPLGAHPPPTFPMMPPPGYAPGYYLPSDPYGYPRDHPRAGLALGLALGGIFAGFFTLGLGFILSPIAWFIGQKVRTEVKQSNGIYHAEGNATAGMILGIIGTLFLGLAILVWIAVIVSIARGTNYDGGINALATLQRWLTRRS